MHELDLKILRFLTCDFDPPWGDVVAQALDDVLLGGLVFLGLTLVGLLSPRCRARLPQLLLALLISGGLAHGIRAVVWKVAPRARPGTVFHDKLLMGPVDRGTCASKPDFLVSRSYPPSSPSFPSSHTVTAGSIAAVIALAAPWPLGVLAWLYAALVGLARVYWSKHWPSDIVGSLAISAGAGWVAWWVAGRIGARRRGTPVRASYATDDAG